MSSSSLTFADQLQLLHSSLHLSHAPSALPCREAQATALRTFLAEHLQAGRGGALYISGSPGTGKSASVEYVVNEMFGQRFYADVHSAQAAAATAASSNGAGAATSATPKSKKKLLSQLSASSPSLPASSSSLTSASSSSSGLPPPRVLYTNAMTFSSRPSSLYPHLVAQLRGLAHDDFAARANLPAPMACLDELQKEWCPVDYIPAAKKTTAAATPSSATPRRRMTLVVLDEVDALLRGPNAAVLYHLLEWPRRPGATLVLVSISNAINLLEQRLPELARRNALPQTLLFTTYSAKELKQIVLQRCEAIYASTTTTATTAAVSSSKEPLQLMATNDGGSTANEDENKDDDDNATSQPAANVTPRKGRASTAASPTATPSKASAKKKADNKTKTAQLGAASSSALSIASLSAMPRAVATAPVSLRSSPRTAASTATVASTTSAVDPTAVRSKRGQKRKTGAVAVAADDDDEDGSSSSQQVPLRVRVGTPSSDAEMRDITAGAEIEATSCVTPKKRHKTSPSASPSPSASASPLSSLSASPLCSPTSISVSGSPTSFFFAPVATPVPPPLFAPATRDRPIFADFALDFLCARVSKGSGDLRKVLEVMRKCVDGLAVEMEAIALMHKSSSAASVSPVAQGLTNDAASRASTPATATASTASEMDGGCGTSSSSGSSSASASPRASSSPSPSPSPSLPLPSLQVSLPLMHGMLIDCLGGSGDQLALLRSLPVQQKVLLVIAALLSHLAGGKELLHNFPAHYAHFSKQFQLEPLRGADFADLLAALAAHRLIKIEKVKGAGGGTASSSTASGFGSGRKQGRPPGSGSSARSAGGSGRGRNIGGSGSGAGRSAAVGALSVQVSLATLEAAFDDCGTGEDQSGSTSSNSTSSNALMQRLLTRGKAFAVSMMAANRAAAERQANPDYQQRNVDDLNYI